MSVVVISWVKVLMDEVVIYWMNVLMDEVVIYWMKVLMDEEENVSSEWMHWCSCVQFTAWGPKPKC